MPDGVLSVEDPRSEDVRALLEQHLAFAHGHTPREHAYALDTGGLLDPAVTLCGYRLNGQLLAVGALKRLDERHAEIKSMHTAQAARGRGAGRAMLAHLIGLARARGCLRVSLETGTMAAFGPARSLYASAGFRPCGPFGGYQPSPHNTFMTLELSPGG